MSEDPTPYGRHDPVVALRLELGRERDRAEAFRNSLNVEVLKVMRAAVIQATIDADNEIARLKDENAQLKAEVERLRAASFVTAVPVEEYEKLKAEVERLRNVAQVNKAAAEAVRFSYEQARMEVERLTGGQTIKASYIVSPEDAERIRLRLEREKGGQP